MAAVSDESRIPEPPEMSPYPAYGHFIAFSVARVGYPHELEEFLDSHNGSIRPESTDHFVGFCTDVRRYVAWASHICSTLS